MQAAVAEDIDRAEPNAEVLLRVARKPWIEFAPGIEFKTLRTSAETGVWTVIFRCARGISQSWPWRTSWKSCETKRPSCVKASMHPWLLLRKNMGPASEFFGVTIPPSRRVVPISSPG